MKTGFVVLILAALGLVLASPATAQVRIGVGINVSAPLHRHHAEYLAVPPYPGAVWVRGHWSWNAYLGRSIWIAGHWVKVHPRPLFREPKFRAAPHGVAKGWWKKHGSAYDDRNERFR
jgi:hypothetical protein